MGRFRDGAADVAPVTSAAPHGRHVNEFVRAAEIREIDEVRTQNLLMTAQRQAGVYNADIEPEHETEWYCTCTICDYSRVKFSRRKTHDIWSKATKYPGEKTYNDLYGTPQTSGAGGLFSRNPYSNVTSPYGPAWLRGNSTYYISRPTADYHEKNIHQTININNKLNREAQAAVDAMEPKQSIWGTPAVVEDVKQPVVQVNSDMKKGEREPQYAPPPGAPPGPASSSSAGSTSKSSKRSSGFFSSLFKPSAPKPPSGLKSIEDLAPGILDEEAGRWPNVETRQIVMIYQEKVGMTKKIADLRERSPIQYLHLLRAGYFEPIPTHWSDQLSNPLKFTIEAAGGWRGITPAWRGYEDTAEERLYWVLNHREGVATTRMKPDFISEMNMARERMSRAVEPPPEYFDPTDVCHTQHTSEGYSKQVLPPAFRPYDREEIPTDDTMILLDVSGSMDFDPLRPKYDKYLITGYESSTQPKNKDLAKAIVRRFTHAMAKHDHLRRESGYDLVTFSTNANHAGRISDDTFDSVWQNVRVGGGTRVMTGWQKVKELHFKKHSESAVHHPVFGWQAGPETPMLRLLLLLDGEATDMDEFELDLLGLSWAHVTIFLIGVDGCPHHHRHANELSRISDVNHHVTFVDSQGNTPERFVTHELLKRHLGQDISLLRFTELEDLPAYAAVI